MPGSRKSGLKAYKTNIGRYGKDFYQKIGALGGKAKTNKPRGFAYHAIHNPKLVSEWGRKGGSNGKRT